MLFPLQSSIFDTASSITDIEASLFRICEGKNCGQCREEH
jgi:hypothetical protein